MPTYAYACSACEHAFDVRQSFSDLPLTTCPQCERETLRKLFSPVGVVFKGSGFYRNDSRAAKGKASGDGGKASGDGGKASGDGAAGKDATGAAGTSLTKAATAGATSGSGSGTAKPSSGGGGATSAPPAGV